MTRLSKTHSSHYTRNVVIQMLVVLVLLAGVAAWQWQTLYQIYINNQVNTVGWAINGVIALLFVCGMLELIRRFLQYHREENAIRRFVDNLTDHTAALDGLKRQTYIAERYLLIQDLAQRRLQINHSALAATLLAAESSRNSFLKFIHNVLILTGVLGTIISLSIALLGASDLIQGQGLVQSDDSSGGLSVMIFGMSTALSTTMTAIIAYLVFGYFYIKLTDTQTYLLSRIEEVSAIVLLPQLQTDKDTAIQDYAHSMRQSAELIDRFDTSQRQYAATAEQLQTTLAEISRVLATQQIEQSNQRVLEKLDALVHIQQHAAEQQQQLQQRVVRLLQEGFRLQS